MSNTLRVIFTCCALTLIAVSMTDFKTKAPGSDYEELFSEELALAPE